MTNTTSPNGAPPKEIIIKSAIDEEDDEDDPISQAVGRFGRWQLQLTFFLSLFNIPCTWHIFAPTFQSVPTDHWCAKPSSLAHLSVEEWRNLSHVTEIKVNPWWLVHLQMILILNWMVSVFSYEMWQKSNETSGVATGGLDGALLDPELRGPLEPDQQTIN